MGETTYATVAWRVDPISQENKYRALMEPNDWLNFQEHLENYTRLNFSKHKLNDKNLLLKHELLLKVQNLQQNSSIISL